MTIKRVLFSLILLLNICFAQGQTQIIKKQKVVDSLLILGDYNKVVDQCNDILKKDSLNSEIFYKLGIAYQNLMLSDKSSAAFIQANKLSPDNVKYNFSLGKYYFTAGKLKLAEPIFTKLCSIDSLNWVYSYYLTDIYMQKGAYNKALDIYYRFYKQDTTNLMYLDKIGYCTLRKGEFNKARKILEKSLSKNPKNIPTLKNLSFIYFRKGLTDTAIYQLNQGISYDSTDIDLYIRRADIYYSKNHHFRARPDYLRVLASGDSSKLVLKRLGIGLAYNNFPIDALGYLLQAYQKDSNDYEISSYIGQTYYKLKQYRKSIKYFNKVLKLLEPVTAQIDYTNILIADAYRDSSLFTEAIKYYSKPFDKSYSARFCLTIANIYDEKLKNYDKAISYYQLFLNNLDKSEFAPLPEYVENVRKRLNWLVEQRDKKVKK